MNWNFLIQVKFLWDSLVSSVMVYFLSVDTSSPFQMEATDEFPSGH